MSDPREPVRESAIDVRPFASHAEFAAMVDYFLGGSDDFLRGMGVDTDKKPTREAWIESALSDAQRADPHKERFYVAWRYNRELVGHSSISHIEWGETAHCHLHLWATDLRRAGLGPAFLERSIDQYFARFELKSIACEPYAENPAPNRALPKLGFRWVERYRTTPTSLAFEQDVNRYVVLRGDWEVRRGTAGGEA